MEEPRGGARRATGPLLSVSVLLAGLIATVLATAALYSAQRDIASRVMDQRHEMALAAIRTETGRLHGLLESLAAGIATDDELTWEDFDVLTGPLVDARMAGAAPVAFVVAVRTADLAETERRWRERGMTGTAFRPNPDNDEHYFGVLNRQLDETAEQSPRTGIDLAGAEPLSTALELARDTRQTTVSDAYVLIRDRDRPAAEQQRSVVFAAPVWTRANVPEFRGWVVFGLRGGTFLRDILRTVARSDISGELVAVNTDGARNTLAAWTRPGEPDLRRSDRLEIADRHWVLETHGDSRHLAGTGWYLPIVALAGGLILTGLLAWLVHVLATGRARARAQVEEATLELREAEAESRRQAGLLGAIMTSISDGVSVVDAEGRVLLQNPAARRFLGVDDDPETPQEWQQHYGAFRADGRTPLPLEEMPLIRALNGEATDGVEVVIRNAGRPDGILLNIDGRPLDASAGLQGAVAVCRDITELRRYEADLSIFAGVVAHDLKAPLAVIRGHADLALADLSEPMPEVADARAGLRRIMHAVDRMDTLIETMLAYTTARHAPVRAVPLDPAPLARESVADRITVLGPDRPAPEWSVGPLPPVQADPAMLRHVLDNLIGNAIKYVRPGGAPRVEVTGGPSAPGWIRIEVADAGIGIPDADKPYIFESFHRTEAAAGYAGTGLGLAICRRIVQRHGGEIGVTDNPGGGTRFWFTLPEAATPPPPADVEEPAMTGEQSRQQHAAEDEEAVREALERALAERAAIMDAARLPGLGVPDEEPAPGRLRAPMPQRERQDS